MTQADASRWINIIHNDVRDAFIQDNLFRQFQEVIRQNERLEESQNVFLYWVKALFKDSIVMAIRRQLDGGRGCVSLRRLLQELCTDPILMHGHYAADEVRQDIDNLDQFRTVRGFADRRVAHADPRGLADDHPTFRDVQTCIEQLCTLVNKYATAVSEEQLSILPPACGTAWEDIFTYAWIEQNDGQERQD